MTKLIIVGGFLGAGKTTLLMESAQILTKKGYKVGLITNDQAEGLVDSVYLKQSGSRVQEVSGSCFCCNFEGFVEAIKETMLEGHVDVILAEPVGSCTDLTATIIRPLLANYPALVELSPLTVLTDPERLQNSLKGQHDGLHESAAYIYRKQLEDAGTILIGKADLREEVELETLQEQTKLVYHPAAVKIVSAKNQLGLEAWLQESMTDAYQGSKPVEMDYDIYAEGEAVLGWLNAELALTSRNDVDWGTWFQSMMSQLATSIDDNKLIVGHIKAIIQNESESLMANITGPKETLQFRGGINPSMDAIITINARVQTAPDILEKLVFQVFENSIDWKGDIKTISVNSLSPGRPNPTYRYSS